MKNQNTQSGITLIALVVTIVVLLILAGITVGFVLSDGGIFASAQEAKINQRAGEISDLAGQIYPAMIAKYYSSSQTGSITFSKAELTPFFPGMTVASKASVVGNEDKANNKGLSIPTAEFTVTDTDGTIFKITISNSVVTKVEKTDAVVPAESGE